MSGRKRQAVAPLRAADLAKTRQQQQAPPAVEPVAAPPEVEQRPAEAPTPVNAATTTPGRRIKYSQNMDEAVYDNIELVVRLSRRSLHRHVTKAEVLDALINRCADDASLRDQIIDDLRNK